MHLILEPPLDTGRYLPVRDRLEELMEHLTPGRIRGSRLSGRLARQVVGVGRDDKEFMLDGFEMEMKHLTQCHRQAVRSMGGRSGSNPYPSEAPTIWYHTGSNAV